MTPLDSPSSTSDRVRPRKVADIVAARIRRMIARGELKEGDWLPTEAELMERFGVSRPTLREAFRLLEAHTLIEIRRGPPGGARVRAPGPDAAAPIFGLLLTMAGTTVRDVYDARMVIEPAAVQKLAVDGSEADHEELAVELARVERATTDPHGFPQASVRFHQRLVELAGNTTLALFVGTIGEVMSQHMAAAYSETSSDSAEVVRQNKRATRSYAKLVDLVRARDGAAAEEFWRKHMTTARPHLLRSADREVIDILD
ncbi:FadR/GntR family transcriptional regulator [Pseudonocardia pini]|uniref:FadR/GntR family transcriptional regulator n=1 Tax=Pseudonocardia pini TaxID=2758030 RepID=UPI001C688A79|nr:FadR/GntR family transcriptional regulator [Pseudonocardia pini]